MTREDLQKHHGFLVQITANGKASFGSLYSENPDKAYILPMDPAPGWHPAENYYLTDKDVEGMSQSSYNTLFSLINLKREGGQASA